MVHNWVKIIFEGAFWTILIQSNVFHLQSKFDWHLFYDVGSFVLLSLSKFLKDSDILDIENWLGKSEDCKLAEDHN